MSSKLGLHFRDGPWGAFDPFSCSDVEKRCVKF